VGAGGGFGSFVVLEGEGPEDGLDASANARQDGREPFGGRVQTREVAGACLGEVVPESGGHVRDSAARAFSAGPARLAPGRRGRLAAVGPHSSSNAWRPQSGGHRSSGGDA
jgi:hypothetical protein